MLFNNYNYQTIQIKNNSEENIRDLIKRYTIYSDCQKIVRLREKIKKMKIFEE
jgi:hypothetical protein